MAVDDLYVLTISYFLPESNVTISLGYKQTAGINNSDTLQSAVEFWDFNVLPLFQDILSVDVEVDQVRLDPVTKNDEIPGFENLIGKFGTVTGDSLPAGGAGVITWITDAPNAKHNGRSYIAGISEADVVDGQIGAPQFGRMVLFGGGYQNTLQTSLPQDAEFEAVTISRVLNGAPRIPPVGFLVQSAAVRSPFFSQSRRITKRLGTS